MNLIWAIGASIFVSGISLIGVLSVFLSDKILQRSLVQLIGFAAGALIGGAFLHLIPHAVKQSRGDEVFLFVIAGFVLFFVMEKYLYWRHCHDGHCEIHTFTYLNLIGDGVHNFVDGLVMGASFFVDIGLGIVTTSAIVFHEIPQEIGDFGILIYGGFSKFKALIYNFLSAVTAVFGTLCGYSFSDRTEGFSMLLIPFAAGGFIYIAGCDLIPELHRQADQRKAMPSMLFFMLGLLFMYLTRLIHP